MTSTALKPWTDTHFPRVRRSVVLPANENRVVPLVFIAEAFAAFVILSGPIWGSWIYYAITGQLLQF